MRTIESKSTSSSSVQCKSNAVPFFQQEESQEAFFGSQQRQEPFFSAAPPSANNLKPTSIQAKLTIGAPNDVYEQEADAMAEQVVQRMSLGNQLAGGSSVVGSGPQIQMKCAECSAEKQEEGIAPKLQLKSIFASNKETVGGQVQRKCEACAAEQIQPMRIQRMGEEEEPELQAKGAVPGLQASADLESRLNATKGSGNPLPDETRSSMESAFGTDFSDVRVHTNSGAVQMNQELGAQAFTHGSDVYFGSGKYDPGSTEGNRLLGHELTHVVQQGGAGAQHSVAPKIQKYDDDDTSGSSWLKMHIPPGQYVLEAANIPVTASWYFANDSEMYFTASQSDPKNIYGLNASPRFIPSDKADMRITPGSIFESIKGLGAAKLQVFEQNTILANELILETLIRFDTLPLVQNIGVTTFVGGSIPDLNPKWVQYYRVGEGGSVTRARAKSQSVTNGHSVTKTRSVTNTISGEVSGSVEANIKIGKAGGGGKVSGSHAVTNAIASQTSTAITETTQITDSSTSNAPGIFAAAPTAKVWATPITINDYDINGKFIGPIVMIVNTVLYNDTYSHFNVADDGKTILDHKGIPFPNQ